MKIENSVLYLEGVLDKVTVPQVLKLYQRQKDTKQISGIDLGKVSHIDSSGVALLDEIRKLHPDIPLVGVNPQVYAVISTFTSLKLQQSPLPRVHNVFEKLGEATIVGWQGLVEAITVASELFYYALVGLYDRSKQRKGTFIQQGVLLGVEALPIVGLLSFIIGFILSLQSAVQLKNFGANVFIADLLAVTMVREMGPMMTAIIVAGRSGSAIASEIATMQVTEEIDALKMMALNPIRYVVVPKFHAITIVMPILVAFSILIGEIGGGLIAISYLDLSVETFVGRSIDIISLKDLVISLGKSIWFAWVIVIIGSYFGFQVKGGAEGVGKATTASVVASIFAVIVFDAIFSLLYL